MPAAGTIAPSRRAFAELLAEARARTVLLVSSLDHGQMTAQTDPELGSVLSQLERIVQFEQRSLLEETQHQALQSYDEWFDSMTDVRQRVLQLLEEVDLADHPDMAGQYRMVLEHEYRRGESMLEILQDSGEPYTLTQVRQLPRGRRLADPGIMVRFPGGTVEIGAGPQLSPWAEERPAHRVSLRAFWLDLMPVTNGDFMTFMGEGGYGLRDVWSDEGWQWVREHGIGMPRHWSWQDGAWWSRCLGREEPLDFTCPVSHVSCFEAEAFARFVGKRLPTEFEWEAAAAWDPETQTRRNYPWGNMPPSAHVANLDQLHCGPASVGAFPGNFSPMGCYGMMGDVWEWTSSQHAPYQRGEGAAATSAGTEFHPDQKVLRGGSWATRSGAIRASSRRSARPGARHLFSGFRCARDA